MEDEIDLAYYVGAISKYWKWILSLVVVAIVGAALFSSFVLPPVYEAEATLWVSEEVLKSETQSGDSTQLALQGGTAVTRGAKSAAVRRQVLKALGDALPQKLRSVDALDRLFSVEPLSGRKPIRLKVRYNDPQLAAHIANTWATVLMDKAQERYAAWSGEAKQLEELKAAEGNLQAAEQALVEFHQTRSVAALEAMIEAQTEVLADYERAQMNIELALHYAQSLKQQLQASQSRTPSPASGLSNLWIELNALVAQSGLASQIQVSLEPSVVSGLSLTEQIERLDSLFAALTTKQQALVTASEEVLPELLKAQAELQEGRLELNHLRKARYEAQKTYEDLSKKVDKARVGSEPPPEFAKVLSQAKPPVKPVAPRKSANIAMAGMLALFTGLFGAFIVEYLRQPPQAGW